MSQQIARLQGDILQEGPLLKGGQQARGRHRVTAHDVQAAQLGEAPYSCHGQANTLTSREPRHVAAHGTNLRFLPASVPAMPRVSSQSRDNTPYRYLRAD
jgi:hypothetical protein